MLLTDYIRYYISDMILQDLKRTCLYFANGIVKKGNIWGSCGEIYYGTTEKTHNLLNCVSKGTYICEHCVNDRQNKIKRQFPLCWDW